MRTRPKCSKPPVNNRFKYCKFHSEEAIYTNKGEQMPVKASEIEDADSPMLHHKLIDLYINRAY